MLWSWVKYLIVASRDVTRLDGARGKKQLWRPHVRTWGLSEANVLYWREYMWRCWGFSALPAVIRRPVSCAPFCYDPWLQGTFKLREVYRGKSASAFFTDQPLAFGRLSQRRHQALSSDSQTRSGDAITWNLTKPDMTQRVRQWNYDVMQTTFEKLSCGVCMRGGEFSNSHRSRASGSVAAHRNLFATGWKADTRHISTHLWPGGGPQVGSRGPGCLALQYWFVVTFDARRDVFCTFAETSKTWTHAFFYFEVIQNHLSSAPFLSVSSYSFSRSLFFFFKYSFADTHVNRSRELAFFERVTSKAVTHWLDFMNIVSDENRRTTGGLAPGRRSRRFLGGVGFVRTLGVGFFVRLQRSNWIMFYITLLSWEFLLKLLQFLLKLPSSRKFLLCTTISIDC